MTALATVVVVSWNGAHLLPACLDALAVQTLRPDGVRVVVVDNASTDDTARVLVGYPDVEVVNSPRNLGFAGGADLGLRTVTSRYAVVLNNDAQPEPEWLDRLIAGFGPGIAAVTSKILLAPRYLQVTLHDVAIEAVGVVTVDDVDVTRAVAVRRAGRDLVLAVPAKDGADAAVVVTSKSGQHLLRTVVDARTPRLDVLNSTGGVLTPTGHGADRGYLEVDRGQYDEAVDVFAVCGAAAAFRTDVAGPAGWFDPWFFAYYEDMDLSWRLRRAGWQVRFACDARVRHEHAATSRVGSDLFLFHNRRNRLATIARNASIQELVKFAAATLRRSPPPESEALVALRDLQLPAATTRRATALMSFLIRLPHLLASRVRPRVPRLRP